jgi:D-alanine-D-alanine ligase
MSGNTMNIGITYDLRQDYLDLGYSAEETAEFDKKDTIDAIETTLQALGYKTDLIGNIWNLSRCLVRGDRWDMVFNIAEGLYGIGREAQVPALLDAYNIPYTFSDPLVLSLTLHKGMTKRIIRDQGLPTPDFVEIHSLADIDYVKLPYPLFVKPIAEGTGKGISASSKIHNETELITECQRLLTTFHQPVLVETYLPGREFTVGIVGTGQAAKALGVMEVLLGDNAESNAYSYHNKEYYLDRVQYQLVEGEIAQQAMKIAVAAWRGLGCRDAGRVDLRADSRGIPNFIEVNPLAGIHPVHSDLPILCRLLGIGYHYLFEMIMESALQRVQDNSSAESTQEEQR